jgi:AraC-like DNA-binding protein
LCVLRPHRGLFPAGNLGHAGGVRMSEAAALVGMSEPTFSKYFKRATGQNFSDLVRKLRLAHARRLLEHSDKPISDICYEVGFSNLSNFNRHFLNDAGETPRSYRQRTQGRPGHPAQE